VRKRVLIAWSGGKDSAWALHVLRRQPDVEIAGLFTTIHEDVARVAVHAVRTALLVEQASAAALPLHTLAIPRPCPNAVYEKVLSEFLEEQKKLGVGHVAFGDLFLEDIRRYRERQFAGSGVELLFPLWRLPTRALAQEMTAAGVRAWIACVDLRRAPREWAGATFDSRFVERMPAAMDPCGENGEFHTFVFEGPMVNAPVRARPGAITEEGGFAYADLLPA
jgi:uncharacterized protein (TIGR00290 family)